MTSQIFKELVPKDTLVDLLEKICIKTKDYLILNKAAYKKAEFLKLIVPFYESIADNYFTAKKFYITRKPSSNSFVTIIRQICRSHNINYYSKIVYNKSTYDIVYNIYI